MTPKQIAIALLVFALALPGASSAMLVTWELEGTINGVSTDDGIGRVNAPELIAQLEAIGVSQDAAWHGRVTFESDTPAEPCGGCVDNAEFLGATRSMEFSAGGFVARTPDGVVGNAFSQFLVSAFGTPSYLVFNSPMVTDSTELHAESAGLAFVWRDQTKVLYTALPSEPPNLADLTYVDVVLFGRGFVSNDDAEILAGGPALVEQLFQITAQVSRVAAVPEPTPFALVLVAAGAIAIRRRSRALP